MLLFAQPSFAGGVLPQGGHDVAGTGTIVSSGGDVHIAQPGSTRSVIDWRSFSIGKGHTVTLHNGSGATVNRVTGGSPSAIFGNLTATGSVYLINPQGIVVGASRVVSTGGRFVASTLDIGNDTFVNGGAGALTLSGTSNASVINPGTISSSGDVFLIAPHCPTRLFARPQCNAHMVHRS